MPNHYETMLTAHIEEQRHAVEGRLQRAAQGGGGRSDNDHQIRGDTRRHPTVGSSESTPWRRPPASGTLDVTAPSIAGSQQARAVLFNYEARGSSRSSSRGGGTRGVSGRSASRGGGSIGGAGVSATSAGSGRGRGASQVHGAGSG
jgi:hypothetical protein